MEIFDAFGSMYQSNRFATVNQKTGESTNAPVLSPFATNLSKELTGNKSLYFCNLLHPELGLWMSGFYTL